MITSAAFDLECTSLDANFGIVLCCVIQEEGKDPVILRGDEVNKQWDKKRSDDSQLVRLICEHLSQFDILCAHNGNNYDVPFLRTRAAHWGLPPFTPGKLLDPCRLARSYFKMRSNSLDSLLDLIGDSTKTRVSGGLWLRAALDGDRKAMDEIVEHCVLDVEMLMQLIDVVKPYVKVFNAYGSAQ